MLQPFPCLPLCYKSEKNERKPFLVCTLTVHQHPQQAVTPSQHQLLPLRTKCRRCSCCWWCCPRCRCWPELQSLSCCWGLRRWSHRKCRTMCSPHSHCRWSPPSSKCRGSIKENRIWLTFSEWIHVFVRDHCTLVFHSAQNHSKTKEKRIHNTQLLYLIKQCGTLGFIVIQSRPGLGPQLKHLQDEK